MQDTLNSIKRDTSDMVATFRGSQVIGRLIRWCLMTAAAVGSLWLLWKGK